MLRGPIHVRLELFGDGAAWRRCRVIERRTHGTRVAVFGAMALLKVTEGANARPIHGPLGSAWTVLSVADMTERRKRTTAIVPRSFFAAGLTTAIPACALAMASACSDESGQKKDYTFVGDVSAAFDRAFVGDVSAHFDVNSDQKGPDAADAADVSDASADADANEDAG